MLVVVYHVICSHWDWTPLGNYGKIIFNGTGAVAIFFVLSGLVLSLKVFDRGLEIDSKFLKKFLLKRILRLYPAFLFVLAFYVGLNWETTSFRQILEEALLMRGQHVLYQPDWTLGVEMALALFVPFLIIVLRKEEKLFWWLLGITTIAGSIYFSEFILLFGGGVWLARHFKEIMSYSNPDKWWYRRKNYLAPLLILLFSFRHITAIYPLPEGILYVLERVLSLSAYTWSGLGSFLILLFVINSSRLRKLLSGTVLVFLGKVSYGVYLSHWFITQSVMRNYDYLFSEFSGSNELVFFTQYTSLALVGSILCGWVIYHLVEVPFIAIARRLAARI